MLARTGKNPYNQVGSKKQPPIQAVQESSKTEGA
jgi:hypothetical protein